MIRLSFYRGLFAVAITATTVSKMADAISVDSNDTEQLLMPQIESGLDSTAATDSEFISTLWNKVKGGAKSLMSKA